MPIAAKLLLCLTAINGSLKVALGMVSGDKMKFLIETLVTWFLSVPHHELVQW